MEDKSETGAMLKPLDNGKTVAEQMKVEREHLEEAEHSLGFLRRGMF